MQKFSHPPFDGRGVRLNYYLIFCTRADKEVD